MSCLTCHDPHRNSETSPAFYEAKCLKCHGSTPVPGHRSVEPGLPSLEAMRDVTKKVACPVNPSRDCVSCHMPKVQTSVPHTSFTDHYIRARPAKPNSGRGPTCGVAPLAKGSPPLPVRHFAGAAAAG